MVIPVWDCPLGTLVACLDTTLRRIGGSPTYALTDNAETVNLLPAYDSFAELADACRTWCDTVNSRRHRATGQIPADRLDIERTTLRVLPVEPLALVPGEERLVGSDPTISFDSVR